MCSSRFPEWVTDYLVLLGHNVDQVLLLGVVPPAAAGETQAKFALKAPPEAAPSAANRSVKVAPHIKTNCTQKIKSLRFLRQLLG